MTMRYALAMLLAVMPVTGLAQTPQPKGPKKTGPPTSQAMAISGLASSGRNCIGPEGANVHGLGWVTSNSRVTISFSSDFDPVGAVTITQLGSEAPDRVARAAYYADDDSGGNLEPQIAFTSPYAGTLVLHVSKYSAERESGCYFYKVEIVTP